MKEPPMTMLAWLVAMDDAGVEEIFREGDNVIFFYHPQADQKRIAKLRRLGKKLGLREKVIGMLRKAPWHEVTA